MSGREFEVWFLGHLGTLLIALAFLAPLNFLQALALVVGNAMIWRAIARFTAPKKHGAA